MMRVFSRRPLPQSWHISSTSHVHLWTRGCSSFHNQPCVSHSQPGARRLEKHTSAHRKFSQDHSDGFPLSTRGMETPENELGLPQSEEVQNEAPARKRKGGMAGLRDLTRKPASQTTRKVKAKDSSTPGRRILGQDSSHPIRARFAPSPTGDLHLGSLRTALFNKLTAIATKGGQFILRIEDTDQRRKVDGAEAKVLEDLKWAGLTWNEGPDVGGPFGPYRQSERLSLYRGHVEKLLEKGHAYRCFCTAEQLEKTKLEQHTAGQATVYPGTCRSVPKDEGDERAAKGEAHVIRFRADNFPRPGFVDQVYGRFKKNEDEDDFILIKQDGFPTYHLANVVDDHLMQITHVIRGEEWLISTPKHIALYQAFGWEPPQFAHLGLLTAPSGRKLSKRDGANSIDDLRNKGVLPMPLNTWLATLGSSIDEKLAMPRSIQELSDRLTFKFTRGGICVDHDRRLHFQTKYWNRLSKLIEAADVQDAQPPQLQSGQERPGLTPASEMTIDLARRTSPKQFEVGEAPPTDALSEYERSVLEHSVYRPLLQYLANLGSHDLPSTEGDSIEGLTPACLWADWMDPASRREQDCAKLPSDVTSHLDHLFRCRPLHDSVREWFSGSWYLFLRPSDITYGEGLDALFTHEGRTTETVTQTHECLDHLLDPEYVRNLPRRGQSLFWAVSRLVVRGHGSKDTPSLRNCINILGQDEMRWRTERVRFLLRADKEALDFPKAE